MYEKLKNGEGSERGWRYEEGDFERVLLEEIGFDKKEELGETGKNGQSRLFRDGRSEADVLAVVGPTGFRRQVDVYQKRDGSWV